MRAMGGVPVERWLWVVSDYRGARHAGQGTARLAEHPAAVCGDRRRVLDCQPCGKPGGGEGPRAIGHAVERPALRGAREKTGTGGEMDAGPGVRVDLSAGACHFRTSGQVLKLRDKAFLRVRPAGYLI